MGNLNYDPLKTTTLRLGPPILGHGFDISSLHPFASPAFASGTSVCYTGLGPLGLTPSPCLKWRACAYAQARSAQPHSAIHALNRTFCMVSWPCASSHLLQLLRHCTCSLATKSNALLSPDPRNYWDASLPAILTRGRTSGLDNEFALTYRPGLARPDFFILFYPSLLDGFPRKHITYRCNTKTFNHSGYFLSLFLHACDIFVLFGGDGYLICSLGFWELYY
ncbi:hypothetical protein B0J13DRAFT_545808 [Dactylonectria estremocensis]|uniref:Uncharacterized protein n=1 Tax=Dactylonectria estremocensis TaxID=1079267 RepID=A0A9P9F7T4_9HYPO|nr:hypothetical protein B0J13DRAFT_545808 [Dactylonectria estremocensis]